MNTRPGIIVIACLLSVAACASSADRPSADQLEADRLLAQGSYEEALAAYRATTYSEETGASSWHSFVGTAICYAHLGDAARFETYALEASSAAPTELLAQRRLGRMFIVGAERFRRQPAGPRYARIGVEYLRRVFFADSDTPNVAHNLGLGLYLLDDLGAASAILEEAHRQTPSRDDTLQLLLSVLRDLDQPARVRELLAARTAAGELPAALRAFDRWAAARGAPAGATDSINTP